LSSHRAYLGLEDPMVKFGLGIASFQGDWGSLRAMKIVGGVEGDRTSRAVSQGIMCRQSDFGG
jgi:hypothetical protein